MLDNYIIFYINDNLKKYYLYIIGKLVCIYTRKALILKAVYSINNI
jgi:hypothetical protein